MYIYIWKIWDEIFLDKEASPHEFLDNINNDILGLNIILLTVV
jgi:hypothetical protein